MLVIIPGYYFFILVGLYFGYRQKNPDRHPKNLDNGRDLKLAYIIMVILARCFDIGPSNSRFVFWIHSRNDLEEFAVSGWSDLQVAVCWTKL